MHTLNCLVAIGGDLQNKAYRPGITVPELMLLRIVHGDAAVTNIEVLKNPRVNQLEERDRLYQAYPKYQKVTNDIWRDNGGKFPTDVRTLQLSTALFAPARTALDDVADAIEDKEVAELKKATPPPKAPKKAAPKKAAPVVEEAPEESDEYDELAEEGETILV